MKKFLITLLSLVLLSGCNFGKKTADPNDKYLDMIELVNSYDDFSSVSDYFDITAEETKLGDGSYRFYIVIDKAKVAMYDVEAIGIEKNVDYTSFMAANVGIFEDSTYTMIPNQANPDNGYVSGIVISGLTANQETSIYLLVQWKSKDLLTTTRQFLKVDVKYRTDYIDEEGLDSSNDFDSTEVADSDKIVEEDNNEE